MFSDARYRGYSLSAGRPVGVVDLSYDDASGLYGAVSASAVASSDHGVRPLGLQLSGGYARQLSRGVTLDVGAVHSRYTRHSSLGESNSYTELYAGVSQGFLTGRVYLSPHYFRRGSSAIYGEVDATVTLVRKVRLNGHVGLLVPTAYRGGAVRSQYDWRLGVAREVGRASLHVIATGGGPGRDYYNDRQHNRTALIVGMSVAL